MSLTPNLNLEKFNQHFLFPHEARCGHEKIISRANKNILKEFFSLGQEEEQDTEVEKYKIQKVKKEVNYT